MTNPNLTHLYFLLDRSGSMESIKDDTEGGFNAFVAEQRATAGECRVTLAQFDNEYEEVYRDRPIADVPRLELRPRGMTALLDSIGRLVSEAGARLAALPEDERPGSVVVGIMTDGHENASRELTHATVKAMIERQTKEYGWQFLYMGADQDAIEVGASIGVAPEHSMTYSRGKVAAMMAAASGNIGRYRTARAAGLSASEAGELMTFSEEQRHASSD
ncbi:von Willebrand factor A [Intrasporangium oryzae NRRL B-24470]|uniref:von Willebrand factor A n=1 Tax=Intrasporangium oryzae NRRL B-24470 TaxID=1386089 RepID=W9G5B8_9MICO|nr:vWA domain-containing protein [Intrasporangium oryzae]EWT01366.1 von Willebrand factor A [Intrasporangium oryzae NRRL B-24470]